MKAKQIILIAAISGALAVALGAFGSHALKYMLTANNRLDVYHTAVVYQFVHTLALLTVGLLSLHLPSRWFTWAAYAFLKGIIIFSGSLYVLCITNIGMLGAITPIGGVAFIAGWVLLGVGIIKKG